MIVTYRIVVVGRGGREHALAWRLARDPEAEVVGLAPGNAATRGRFPSLPVDETDPAAVVRACRQASATLVVIGPEASLAAGVADALAAARIPVYGPTQNAARIESSKWFAKEIMTEAGVPTARATRCGTVAAALSALGDYAPPWVIKADGLAAGKGVLVSADRAAVETFLRSCLESAKFGDQGAVVIEELLSGEEVSVMAVCDGTRHVVLPSARDHKRAFDGDQGPNTGGMGAFAPSPRLDAAGAAEIGRQVIAPVLARLAARGTPFRGTLYAGLMLTAAGPRVLEFNARFGDPETQVVMPLVDGSLVRLLASAAHGTLDADAVRVMPGATVGVTLVDDGYPERVQGTGVIEGLDRLETRDDTIVFHSGTVPDGARSRVTGGRAVTVVARGATVAAARAVAYRAVDTLGGSGWRCRRDIAADVAVPVSGGRT